MRAALTPVFLPARKRIALVAHDHCKPDLLEWARFNASTLEHHELFATGTTGRLLELELGLKVSRLPRLSRRFQRPA